MPAKPLNGKLRFNVSNQSRPTVMEGKFYFKIDLVASQDGEYTFRLEFREP